MSAPDQDDLDRLERDIDGARRDADEALGTDADEPRFIDEGTVGDEVVDNQIAPPG